CPVRSLLVNRRFDTARSPIRPSWRFVWRVLGLEACLPMLAILKETWDGFNRHKATRSAAALAYYALFSLPALLFISISVAGSVARYVNLAKDGEFRQLVSREATESLGEGAADQINQMIDRTSELP